LLFLIISSLFLSCKTAEFGFKVIDINGMVYDFGSRPIASCNVYIDNRYYAETDINGRFSMAKVPEGSYKIQVSKKGYETYTGDIRINDRKQVLYMRTPSLQQLLDMVDSSLEQNQMDEALSFINRALSIGEVTTELLFYAAVVQFRLGDIQKAGEYLQRIKSRGSHDVYLEKFLQDIQNLEEKE
jgi:tetratricopeptide (TPR) repeat protein